jgi:hypothetical protein
VFNSNRNMLVIGNNRYVSRKSTLGKTKQAATQLRNCAQLQGLVCTWLLSVSSAHSFCTVVLTPVQELRLMLAVNTKQRLSCPFNRIQLHPRTQVADRVCSSWRRPARRSWLLRARARSLSAALLHACVTNKFVGTIELDFNHSGCSFRCF